MRRKSRHRSRRRSNPTVGTGTTLAVIGAVLAGGTLLYAGLANAAPAAPTPRPTTAPPAPAPPENPAATAAQPGAPASTGNDAAHDAAAPAPEVSDNPVRVNPATGAEERVFPDHVVAILAEDTALFTSPSNTDPARRRIATMRAGQRVNVRLDGAAVRSRRLTSGGSFVVSVYGVNVGGAMRDGYAAISRAELPPGTLVTGAV